LADSIRHNGILQPVNVRRGVSGRFELISGERRLRAARIAGLALIPCILMEASDEKSAVFALLENLQRQNLGFFEEADAIARLYADYGMSQEELAHRLGKAQSTLSNKLRLLRLPPAIRELIQQAGLTERHARALLKVNDEAQMCQLLGVIIARGLNVAETELLIERALQPQKLARRQPKRLFKDLRLFINTLNHAVDTMRKAGINAASQKNETEDYIEYTVRIPKAAGPESAAHLPGPRLTQMAAEG
jgi:ParB family chromosome partitioning protein